jgi:hypothetical protein
MRPGRIRYVARSYTLPVPQSFGSEAEAQAWADENLNR